MEAILATQVYPAAEDDWTGWQNRVNYDVFAEAPPGPESVNSSPVGDLSVK